jgi:hypothetical protein
VEVPMLSGAAAHVHRRTGMKRLQMAVLLGFALFGNLLVDWLTHREPEPNELIGALVIGMVLSLGFRTKQSKS